ncbi:MAG: hypothetical protein VYB59_17285 [Pseudomonadota bacterium]|nr:hypothetical protein [Pseudomonadota bacterium]
MNYLQQFIVGGLRLYQRGPDPVRCLPRDFLGVEYDNRCWAAPRALQPREKVFNDPVRQHQIENYEIKALIFLASLRLTECFRCVYNPRHGRQAHRPAADRRPGRHVGIESDGHDCIGHGMGRERHAERPKYSQYADP